MWYPVYIIEFFSPHNVNSNLMHDLTISKFTKGVRPSDPVLSPLVACNFGKSPSGYYAYALLTMKIFWVRTIELHEKLTDCLFPVQDAIEKYNQHINPIEAGQMSAILQTTFKSICMKENMCILFQFSLNFFSKYQINNKPTLFQILTWLQTCDNHYLKQWCLILLTHTCVPWSWWVDLQGHMSCFCVNSFDFRARKIARALQRECSFSSAKSNELTQ